MPFEQAENELLFEEFEMLRDIYYALEHLNDDENYKITNSSIKRLVTSSNEILKRYPEAAPKFDPFKSKLLNGLTIRLGELGSRSIDGAKGLRFQTESETTSINRSQYPYKPDLLFSHNGNTIALWLTNRSKFEYGAGKTNANLNGEPYTGAQLFHEKILRKMNPHRNIKNVYITVEDMVDYDLPNMKASINTASLSKLKFLNSGEESQNIQDLVKFTKWFLDQENTYQSENKLNAKNLSLYKNFIETLTEFFEARELHKTRPLDTAETSSSSQKF